MIVMMNRALNRLRGQVEVAKKAFEETAKQLQAARTSAKQKDNLITETAQSVHVLIQDIIKQDS